MNTLQLNLIHLLRMHGWQVDEVYDLCWLDCASTGFLLVAGDQCICLCPEHALVLQAGCWGGDYSGAPLPPESCAVSWPWQSASLQAA